jgi:hypothetical protein
MVIRNQKEKLKLTPYLLSLLSLLSLHTRNLNHNLNHNHNND